MNFILLLATFGFITGFFSLLGISPTEFTEGIFGGMLDKPTGLRGKINQNTKRKKDNFLVREIREVHSILKITGRGHQFPFLCATSLFCFFLGGSLALLMANWFLVPVLALGFMFLPFWYVKLTQTHFKRDLSDQLETGLSVITSAYLRTENIVTAVEENILYLNQPVLGVFKGFLHQTKMVDPDVTKALRDIHDSLENSVYQEWIDALILCQQDRNLKSTLSPIVSKLSDMRVVNAELDLLITAPRQEYMTMVVLLLSNIPLLFFLNYNWYHTLMFTFLGKIILAVCGSIIFLSAARVIKVTKPIEYRR